MKKNSWQRRQATDVWVQKAKKEGYVSRAAYKLLEIVEKDRVLRAGDQVVDLGSAPGGWSQVASFAVGSTGRVIAVDLLDSIQAHNIEFLKGDFTDEKIEQHLLNVVKNQPIALVMSDMAPNMSGIAVADQAKSIYLCELALDFALKALTDQGHFLVKVFQGAGFEDYLKMMRSKFSQVKTRKPEASRPESREVYLLATGKKPLDIAR